MTISLDNSPAIKLKTALTGRQRLLVVNIDFSSSSLVSYLAQNIADVIFIDCEQGDTSIETIPDLVRASHLAGTPVVVRLPNPEAATIERYMFRGVDGIVVPRLDTPADAKRVVEAMAYCYGPKAAEKSIIVQIESGSAAERLDEFLAVEGLDALFVGPVDLSRSLGFSGDFSSGHMQQVIADLLIKIAGAGRSAGMLVDTTSIERIAGLGTNFFYLHATDFLLHGTAPFFAVRQGPL